LLFILFGTAFIAFVCWGRYFQLNRYEREDAERDYKHITRYDGYRKEQS
jgi:hypothetical protein